MKIITKSNFDEELYTERTIAENVDQHYDREMVNAYNDIHWKESSHEYLKLASDDYENYDGYKQLM